MYIAIIRTHMQQVGGKLWTLRGWWVMGTED